MSCTEIENNIVDYIDGLLAPEDAKVIEAHIDSCTSCKKMYHETKQLFSAFSDEPIAQPTTNLRMSFEQMLEKEKQVQPKVIPLQKTKRSSYISILQVAASVAILITGYLLGGYQENKNSQQEIANYKNEQKQLKENILIGINLINIRNRSIGIRGYIINWTISIKRERKSRRV